MPLLILKEMKILKSNLLIALMVVAQLFTSVQSVVAQTSSQQDAPKISPNSSMTQAELDLWNDPEFRKQFQESYIAETEIEPTVTVNEREVMQEILDLISSDQLDQAAALLQENMNEASSAVFDFTLANIYFQQDKLEDAAPLYQQATEKYPKFRRAWKNLGVIYVRQQDFERALPALTRVIELGGNDSVIYGMLGFSYSAVGNFLSAESAYRQAILLDPETLDWKVGLARSFFKQSRYAEAVAITGQLIERNPERADLWLLQANAYIGLKQPLEAAEIYEIVDHMGESTVDSLNMLGDIYVNEELYGLAVNSYIRALEREPGDNPNPAIQKAKILAARAAYNETRQMINKIDELYTANINDEQKKEILKLESRLAVAQGSAEDEIEVLKEIVALDPLDGEALILLGQHYANEGDTAQAIFYFERAANLEDYEAEANVRHAQVLVKEGKYAEALPLLRRAQQINPRENVQKYLEQVERLAKTS